MTAEEIRAVEREINSKIMDNLPISYREMSLKEAQESGAMAFFGDKYGETVRVVSMGDYSRELCGGTHCRATGEIGLIKILSEAGIGSSLRRIEALTGWAALNYYQEQESRLMQLAQIMKVAASEAYNRLETLLTESREQGKEIEKLLAQKAKDRINGLIAQAQEIDGINVLAAQIDADNIDIKDLRNYLDLLRDRMDNAAIVLAAKSGDKVHLVAAATEKAQAHGLHAGQVIKHIAAIVGGSGGGRPDMAQAGGKDPEKIREALEQARKLFVEKLEG
jgi:alanyl-tRNA synthetase